ncbi:hypothetical protein U2G60_001628 [Vibrio fluvialis]|jgi:hypothetical protein|nr:hypothetical protein [Vibrio fluvialis]
MAVSIRRRLSTYEAVELTRLAKESQNFINNVKPNPSQYPPTVKFNDQLSKLVDSISPQIEDIKVIRTDDDNENSISSLLNTKKTTLTCDLASYEQLQDSVDVYLRRKNPFATLYIETIVSPLAKLLKDTANTIDSNEIEGLVNQLKTRQKELNQDLIKTKDSITQVEQSFHTRSEREFSRLTNNVKKLESEVLQKLENVSSDTQIKLQEIANIQRLDLAEQTAKQIDDALEIKRKSVFDHLEHDSNRLLSLVQKEVSSLSTRVNQEVNEFCLLNEALRKTLKFISSDALADASIAQATIEKESADKLRIFGVSWLLLSIFLFLTTFDYEALVDKNGVPQYTLILLRSFFLIVGSAPAFYLLRESARHRTDERRYRQKGIQLATIDGYLAEFEGADRNNVKKELTKHYFHGGDHFVDSSSVDSVQGIYEKILDRLLSSEKNKTTQESQKDNPA